MAKHTPENYAAAQKLHALAREFRGQFLNHIAVIEHEIAQLLTDYFCTSDEFKQQLFFERVACRLSLEQKRAILAEVIKNDYPSYWEANGATFNTLKEIQEFRNKLAHSILDVSDEVLSRPLSEGVSFVQWKGGAPITEHEFDMWCVKANMISTLLVELRRLLPYKENRGE